MTATSRIISKTLPAHSARWTSFTILAVFAIGAAATSLAGSGATAEPGATTPCVDCGGRYANWSLSPGFFPDPHARELDAGGDFDAARLGPDCVGAIARDMPDVALDYGGGPLSIFAVSQSDVSLVVLEPGGAWRCADDVSGANPGLGWARAAPGAYRVWVGAEAEAGLPRATLFVSESPAPF